MEEFFVFFSLVWSLNVNLRTLWVWVVVVGVMAALQRVTASCVSSTMTTSMRYGSCTGGGGVSLSSAGSVGDGVGLTFAEDVAVSDQFPVGLRVLVVDDDTTCLRILEQMLHRCLYNGLWDIPFYLLAVGWLKKLKWTQLTALLYLSCLFSYWKFCIVVTLGKKKVVVKS